MKNSNWLLPPKGEIAFDDNDGIIVNDLDLTQPIATITDAGVELPENEQSRASTPQGLQLQTTSESQTEASTALASVEPIAGDFELVLDFDDLELKPIEQGSGSGMSVRFHLDDDADSSVILSFTLDSEGQPVTSLTHEHLRLGGTKHEDALTTPGTNKSGCLRMVRIDGTVYALYASERSGPFEFIGSHAVGAAPIRRMEVATMSTDEQADVKVTLSKLLLRQRQVDAVATR